MKRSPWLATPVVIWLTVAARADVQLERLFADHAVLQRNQPVPIWGSAAPGESVTVEFAGQSKSTAANAAGRWSVTLDPLSAKATPQTLRARGRNLVEVRTVVVGEVWLFSGQSNMALLMDSMARPSERDPASAKRARDDIAAAADPLLREFRVDNRPAERPRHDVPTRAGWMTWNPGQAGGFAAMAAYFGRRLRESLDVPVGIVMCAWGGSGCSAWIGADTLRQPPLNAFWPEEVSGWTANVAPTRLYNGMLHPVAPLAIAGFGWYQGETEATPAQNPYLHRFLLPAMIEDWRRLWRRPELPFYFIQLPNRDHEPRWVVVRESQAAALRLPHTAMVPTIDIGQAWDLHPKNKHEVAGRLADLILARHYGRGTWPDLAMPDRPRREGAALRVTFRDAPGGLRTRDGEPPRAFALAGEDRVFRPAEARIDGSAVVVVASTVPQPVAVRYAWEPAPQVNLTNAGSLPVPPFRSDDWPVDGEEMLGRELPVRATLSQSTKGADLAAGHVGPWAPCADIGRLGASADLVLRRAGAAVSILARGFPVRDGAHPSPEIFWTAEPPLETTAGLTLEVSTYVTRTGNPLRGLDLEAGVRRADGSFRRYLLTAFPMRLHTFQNNLTPRTPHATETVVLRSDLEMDPAVYRLAIRPDGIAQIYLNGELIGTSRGETLERDIPPRPYLRVGKTLATGAWAATLHHVAFDATGAFAPASGRPALRRDNAEP